MAERPPVEDWATDFDHTDPRWIADPQGIKPGNRMPQVKLTTQELQAVAAYLETLS